ncbi:MAG: RnfABCDGE type electron transport complex subunit D [Candidatus Aenigmarchaeota archaeon]|nr:RnfABCDGE type electron transport complex subunit D [Candidatus Aenigmarchaeota archaeon]
MAFRFSPHRYMIAALLINIIISILLFGLNTQDYALHVIITTFSAIAFDSLVNYVKLRKKVFSESSAITGLILSILLPPMLISIAASAIAIAAKHLIRRQVNIFNPAATGALVLALAGLQPSWWAANTLAVIIFLYADYKVKRLTAAASFFAVWALVHFLAFPNAVGVITNFTVLFFIFVMLIEPVTSPHPRKAQILYGAIAAILASAFHSFLPIDFLLPALLLSNLLKEFYKNKLKSVPKVGSEKTEPLNIDQN